MSTKLRRKIVPPKVFAVELKSFDLGFLWVGVAYCLEDAASIAREEALEKYTHTRSGHWQIGKYTFEPLETLVTHATKITLTPEEVWQDKNTLMKEIIATKNTKLFEVNRSRFSEVEVKMLQEKLNVG